MFIAPSIAHPTRSPSLGSQPRFTMPTIHIPFTDSTPPLLPLNADMSSPPPSRRSARRISYTLKNRATQYSIPLALGALVTSALLLMLYYSKHSTGITPYSTNAARLHLYERAQGSAHHANGVSLLVQDEDELIAEDDLFWQTYEEPEPLTDLEVAAEEELRAHRADVLEHDRANSLRALIYWLAEGGVFPDGWEVPSKSYLRKIGGRGVERLLEAVEKEYPDEVIFDEGWAEFARGRFRIVVFSKVRDCLSVILV